MLPKKKRPSTKSKPKHSKTNCDIKLECRKKTTFILSLLSYRTRRMCLCIFTATLAYWIPCRNCFSPTFHVSLHRLNHYLPHRGRKSKRKEAGSKSAACLTGLSRDFLLLVFFSNQFPPSPRVSLLDRFEFVGKFAEIFASQGAPPVSTPTVAHFFFQLPPVSTTPVVHLELRISPRIFEKIWNGPTGILRSLEETDSWKKPEVENLVTLSL